MLRFLDLDFQPRTCTAAGALFLTIGVLAVAVVALDYRTVAAETESWQATLARLQESGQRRPIANLDDERQLQQVAQAAANVARDIQRPWEKLFAALESAKSDDIALLSLAPDAERGVVRIGGEAKRREAILAYMTRLGQGGVLRNVFLVEDQVQQQDPERPVRFLISADWAGVS